jgi:HEAT repeat protein
MAAEAVLPDVLAAIRAPDTAKEARWVLIRALGANPSPAARDAVVELLSSKDALDRMAALGALGDRGDKELASRAATLLRDPAILVRSAAAEALGRLRDPTTVQDLASALADPSNFYRGTSLWVRRQFVDAIAAIGGESAVPHLGLALDDGDASVVGAAKAGLERIAGFSYSEGRSSAEELAAWKRWAQR